MPNDSIDAARAPREGRSERSGDRPSRGADPDPEVVARATRRRFTAEYKARIVSQADACTKSGEIGALLRREGLHSSHLAVWRRDLRALGVGGPAAKRRGPAPAPKPSAREVDLERRARKLETQLAQAQAIIAFQKNARAPGDPPEEPRDRRGRLVIAVSQARDTLGVRAACTALGLPRATWYRARTRVSRATPDSDDQTRPSVVSPRALQPAERALVIDELNSERFADIAVPQVHATLLEEGRYFCSQRTMYRILKNAGQVRERRDQLRHPAYTKPELLASAPNQLGSWDITKLKGPATWNYFHLCVILRVYSRCVVGWMVAEHESAVLAAKLIEETIEKQGVEPGQLTIHADRGSSMTSKQVAFLLAGLGVTKTHSRPHVSDDNPYSEAQFKTLKYRPDFPDRFGSIQHARQHCQRFFDWYNREHRHSGVAMMTPIDVHLGRVAEIVERRAATLDAAQRRNPERFVRGAPAQQRRPQPAWINPPAAETAIVAPQAH